MAGPGISAAIITKNEEANIQRCLDSLTWADEVVVVDTGSTDGTVAICRQSGCKVHEADWMGFGRSKQFCVDQTAFDWVLSIDADEVVSDELKKRLSEFKDSGNVHGYRIKRRTYYLGRLIRYSGWQRDYPLRLFKKSFGKFTDEIVHEQIQVNGTIETMEPCLFHHSFPDLASHLKKVDLYSRLGAEKLAEKGKKSGVVKPLLRAVYKFFTMYIINLGFLDKKEGLALCVMSAFSVCLKYFRLWEICNRKQRGA